MQEALFPSTTEHIFTVSELNREIKENLEEHYSHIALVGEISNFHAHSSGHYYFRLKDAAAQIGAVMFRNANRLLKFEPEDGLEVIVRGRVSLYEPRGDYQFYVEAMEPKGMGSLQLAFEQLRKRLEQEGLFAEANKKPLPFLPHTIGLVTSPTGAAIRDLIHVLHRRNPKVNLLICPVSVQGTDAAPDIARGIEILNEQGEAETLIVGRGGGSLEDLWAFNTEVVARAIAASKIPVISAVGHETDFTISDFAADLRAPTPSAAAELAVPVLKDLEELLQNGVQDLNREIFRTLEDKKQQLKYWRSHLKHPLRRVEEMSQKLDELRSRLEEAIRSHGSDRRLRLAHLTEKLQVLSPLSILGRGYAIVQQPGRPGRPGKVLKEANRVKKGDPLAIRLWKGEIKARVE